MKHHIPSGFVNEDENLVECLEYLQRLSITGLWGIALRLLCLRRTNNWYTTSAQIYEQ